MDIFLLVSLGLIGFWLWSHFYQIKKLKNTIKNQENLIRYLDGGNFTPHNSTENPKAWQVINGGKN